MNSKYAGPKNWYYSLVVCVILIATFSVSAEEITFNSAIQWEIGEKNNYTISKTRSKSRAGKVVSEATSHTDVDIEVVDVTKAGYIVSWEFGETKFDDPTLSANPIVKSTSNLLKGVEMLLELNLDGSISGIKNWKEVQRKSHSTVQELVIFLKESGKIPSAQLAQIEQQVKSMYSTKEQIVLLTTREAQLFFFALGREYTLGEPISYELELPNPFGGSSFLTEATLELEVFDIESDKAKVVWEQEFDSMETKRVMLETMTTMSSKSGTSKPTESDLPEILISEFGEFNFEVSSVWIEGLKHKRTTKIGGDSQSDVLVIIKK